MQRISVCASGKYDVLIGGGLLGRAGEEIRNVHAPCRAAVVTDETVLSLYGEALRVSLARAGFVPCFFSFPAGEQSKTMGTLEALLRGFLENGVSRGDMVVALGGGVVGDTAGFAAAVYQRGVPFVQIPTTLLSAVDASVGGKTGVDLPGGKNMAGAFHQPALVLCDTDILRALPGRVLREGLSEVVKYAILKDAGLPGLLLGGQWRERMEEMTAACVSIKRAYVEADERDGGDRRFLNLGHTFGHAVETLSGFRVSHGEAVAMGLMMAARAGGMDVAPVRGMLTKCGLPTEAPYPAAELSRVALSDKKRQRDTITLVLPRGIGDCVLRDIPIGELPGYFAKGIGKERCR